MEEILDELGGLQVINLENTASVSGVLDALVKATTQNPELLKVAENQLTKWGTEPGFYSILLNIAFDQNIDLNVRWLAILCSKNGIEKYWRNVITDDEKCAIQHKLLSSLFEPNNQIALQLTVLIAKVAYYDLTKWQKLFPTLINGIQSTEEFHHLRSLLTLSHIVKIFAPISEEDFISYIYGNGCSEMFQQTNGKHSATGDTAWHQEPNNQITHAFFPIILNQWINSSTSFIDTLQTDAVKASPLLESAFLCLKMLKYLVLGFKDISEQPDALKFLDLIFKQFKPFLESRLALMNMEHTRQTCEKYVVLLVKVLITVKKYKRSEFAPFLQSSLECGVMYCFNNDFQNYIFEDLIIRFLNLLTEVSVKETYQRTSTKAEKEAARIIDEKNKPLVNFYSHSVLNEIFQQLLSKYFPLTEKELYCWKNDPEEFAIQDRFLFLYPEGNQRKRYREVSKEITLRPTAENFFIVLAKSFQDIMSTLVFEAVDAIEINNVNSAIDMLKKDAVYLVVGLAALDMFHYTKYNELFINVLLPELKNKSNNYCIIRRRVAWLIGYCCLKLSSSVNDSIQEALVQCVVKEEDLVVRLTAVHSLRCFLSERSSIGDEELFHIVKDVFPMLFQLILEVEELELKLLVLSTLNCVLRRRIRNMNQHLMGLVDYLPRLWNQCGNHNLLQCAIITSFTHLVRCFAKESEKLHPVLLPMITFSTDHTQPFHVYLLEDGLNLLYSVLEYALSCSADLMNVSTNLMSILEKNDENFEVSLKIIEAYILLAPDMFLMRHGQNFVETSKSLVRNLEPEKIKKLLMVVEVIFLLCPVAGPVHFQPLLLIVMDLGLHDIKDRRVSQGITLSLLSHVILNNKTVFLNILQEKAAETEKNTNIILGELLTVWLLRISRIWSDEAKKIMALALSCLLTSDSEIVYDRFAGILYGIVEILNSLSEFGGNVTDDSLIRFSPEQLQQRIDHLSSHMIFASYHEIRKNELRKRNPVYFVKLRDYFHEQIIALEKSVGTSKFEELMTTVDIQTKTQITKYLQA